MRVEDVRHVLERQSGNGGDFGFRGVDQREPRHRRSAQIVERDALDSGLRACLAP